MKRQPIPFGKYLLLDRINIGGMAEVWRAKTFGAGGFERLVAIKRILPNIAEDEEFISMFIDEAKITVQLNHANIAQIYELSSIASSYFISMEYVSGKDMRAVFDRCRKRGEPAPIPLSAYAIAQCCEGLDYAHRANDKSGRPMNIVHRDVSPQNAIVSYEGEVKIIDFGIAKAAGKATKTQAGILKGKFGYMSPEQIRGLPLDRRSDVFAIGVCLYEMLTGERLFVGDSDFSVLEKVRKVEVLPPSHFNRKIPDTLEKIVMKALAKDVDERYQYAGELAEDLRKFLYTSGYSFSRKDLAAFMKATFAEDVEKERQRLQEYNDIRAPEGMLVSQEPGFGLGQVSGAAGLAVNASAVTAIPTLSPPVIAPAVPKDGLPPIVRSVPPPVAQARPSAPPPPARAASLPAMPKLSAAQPVHVDGKGGNDATVLSDGPADAKTNPGQDSTRALDLRSRPDTMGTDPAVPVLVPRDQFLAGADSVAASGPGSSPDGFSGPPVLGPRGSPSGELPFRASPPTPDAAPEAPALLAVEGEADTSPHHQPAAATVAQLAPVTSSSNTLLFAIIAMGLLIVLTLIGLGIALKPSPRGLLIIELPESLAGKARVNINGKDLLEPDGSLIKEWPQIREVPVGRNTVMIVAPGYETLTDTVDVQEGNDYTPLNKKLKKKSAE